MTIIRLHTGAWLWWLVAVFSVLAGTRNPWYVGLALLWITIVGWVVQSDPSVERRQILSPWRFGLIVVPVTAILNALLVRVGASVLFTIPEGIPLLGGPITAEALLYGALNGLVLTGLYAAFGIFNRVTPLREIVRIVPSAYYPLAVTMAVALTFVPVTLRKAVAIREAQAVRGFRLRGVRGWMPLFLPLLTSGLEQSMLLSEAMVARGFASSPTAASHSRVQTQGGVVLGLALFAAGWVARQFPSIRLTGNAAMLCGVALIVAALWLAGRQHQHTVYRPTPWRGRDWFVTVLAIGTILCFLVPLPWVGRMSLVFESYPEVHWPQFSLIMAVASWGLLGPAFVGLSERA